MPRPQRVLVIGTSGSGKTTLGRRVAAALDIPHAEQDGWNHLPGWQEAPLEQFRAEVERFTALPAWVMDGNYSKARDIGWPRADTLVWLDYPALTVFWRLLRRTLRRMSRREVLWNGNRERRSSLLSRNGMLAWFFQTHWKLRRTTPVQIAQYPHLKVIRLRHPREAEAWVGELGRDKNR
jgi:adenylate kinase family enzyme